MSESSKSLIDLGVNLLVLGTQFAEGFSDGGFLAAFSIVSSTKNAFEYAIAKHQGN